jgi:hypothetical protein
MKVVICSRVGAVMGAIGSISTITGLNSSAEYVDTPGGVVEKAP